MSGSSRSLLCLAGCLLLLRQASALLPTVCVENVTNADATCCPIPDGFAQPCGGPGRGECVRVQAYKEYEKYHPALDVDDRMQWPQKFVKFACQCDARFWGADCGECFFGWKGHNCTERDVRVRRNIFDLSDEEKLRYREITRLMRVKTSDFSILIEKFPNQSDPLNQPQFKQATVHEWLVYIHRYASRKTVFDSREDCRLYGKLDLNHGGPGFITWHRYFTMMLERELHKLAVAVYNWVEFGLPYWDWVDATWCEVCHNNIVGSPGDCDENGQRIHVDSPFFEWDEFCSAPARSSNGGCAGCHAGEPFNKLNRMWTNLKMPTTAEVEFALSLDRFYIPGEFGKNVTDLEYCGFCRFLEGHCGPEEFYGNTGTLHNKVHDSVRGSFCCAGTAPNDPIFFMHHSQISRIVDMWFRRYWPHLFDMANVDVMPGHARQSYMVGFYPPIRHEEVFVATESLGYRYDTLQFGEPVRRRLAAEKKLPLPTLRHFTNCQPGFLHPQVALHRHNFEEELRQFERLFPPGGEPDRRPR